MPDQTKLDRCDCGAPIASDGACENDAHDDTTRTDGPDTELAAEPRTVQLTRWALAEGGTVGRLAVLELLAEYDGLRAYLARPAAGRDLTAQDVRDAARGWAVVTSAAAPPIAEHLNEIARPAVARTDGQTPADDELYEPLRAEIRAGAAAHDRRIGRVHGDSHPEAPIVVAVRPGTGMLARRMSDGRWYVLDVIPGGEPLHDAEVGELQEYEVCRDGVSTQ